MADNNSGGGNGTNAFLAFIVGGLLVVVAVVAFAMYSGKTPSATKKVDVDITASLPRIPAPAAPAPTGG